MKKLLNSKLGLQKGFTLIELLVVIAILGVLAAGVLIAIDPVDKINAANDSKAQTDTGVKASASEAYATSHSGFYPLASADLLAGGELKSDPSAPTGYTYTFWASAGVVTPPTTTIVPTSATTCTAGSTCTAVVITSTLKSKKWSATPFQRYESYSGKSCQVATATTVCP